MTCQELGVVEVKTDQKGTELVNPGERTLTDKTVWLYRRFGEVMDRLK